jgi:uncharacterized surface protein with fasciclin (FAS1) repeats
MYKRALAAVGIAVAASTIASIAAVGPVSAADSKTLTIADVLLSDDAGSGQANVLDKNWRDYDLLTAAVLAVGATDLVPAAANKNAALTVLAPNDQAFRLLAQNVAKKSFRTEQQVLDALLAVEASSPGIIKTILTYHIIPAKLDPATVLASDNAQITTLGGGTFAVDVISKRAAFVQFVDGDPNARNAYLNKINVGGGELANGYIHGVDRVLRPIDL